MELKLINKKFKKENMGRLIVFQEMETKLPTRIRDYNEKKITYTIGNMDFILFKISGLYVADIKRWASEDEKYDLSLIKFFEYLLMIEEEIGKKIIIRFNSVLIPRDIDGYMTKLKKKYLVFPNGMMDRVKGTIECEYFELMGMGKSEARNLNTDWALLDKEMVLRIQKVCEFYRSRKIGEVRIFGTNPLTLTYVDIARETRFDGYEFIDNEYILRPIDVLNFEERINENMQKVQDFKTKVEEIQNYFKEKVDLRTSVGSNDLPIFWYDEYRAGIGLTFKVRLGFGEYAIESNGTDAKSTAYIKSSDVKEVINFIESYVEKWFKENQLERLINPDYEYLAKKIGGKLNDAALQKNEYKPSDYDYKGICMSIAKNLMDSEGVLESVDDINVEVECYSFIENKKCVRILNKVFVVGKKNAESFQVFDVEKFKLYLNQKHVEAVNEYICQLEDEVERKRIWEKP